MSRNTEALSLICTLDFTCQRTDSNMMELPITHRRRLIFGPVARLLILIKMEIAIGEVFFVSCQTRYLLLVFILKEFHSRRYSKSMGAFSMTLI